MSLPHWFYPLVMVWLIAVPGLTSPTPELSSKRSAWIMWIDSLFLLPWILSLFLDEALAAWVGVEILVLVLLFDLLWKNPTEALREAWIKVSMNWFLSWLLVGTAVALSGVHPIVENLFYPLPSVDLDRIRPVLAGFLFLIGLCLKFGLPPLQQGLTDLLDVMRPEDHRRWSLQLRFALIFAAWQLMPDILGALSPFNQQIFAAVLILACLVAVLVSGVQASVQRSLSYLGSVLLLPPLLFFLFIDQRAGMTVDYTLALWVVTILGFLLLASLYQGWPRHAVAENHGLLWSDPDSPCAGPGWFFRWRAWLVWSLLTFLGMAALSAWQGQWFISFLLILLALSCASATVQQLGIASWKQQNQRS